jgi:hypothetical protein
VVVSPLLSLLLSTLSMNFSRGYYGSPSAMTPILMTFTNAVGPMLQGACIICGLLALIPPMAPRGPIPGPVKHPME